MPAALSATSFDRAYAVCREVQEQAVAAVRAMPSWKALDGAYRERLETDGYSVDHSLGHGVGLEIHEEPRLARTSADKLQSGQVGPSNPGSSLPGVGGVRIEDMVIVEDSGGQVITHATKDLARV